MSATAPIYTNSRADNVIAIVTSVVMVVLTTAMVATMPSSR